jgi:hypothetical protein
MKPETAMTHPALEQRLDRIGLGVRCAYDPPRPDVLHRYMQAGRQLSRLQPQTESRIQRRMLDLLLHTAADQALPWPWRAACLEHTTWPLARLISLEGGDAQWPTQTPAQFEERIRRAAEQLGLPPKAPA